MTTEPQSDAPPPTLTSLIWAMRPGDELHVDADSIEKVRSVQTIVSTVKRASQDKRYITRDFMTKQSLQGVIVYRRP